MRWHGRGRETWYPENAAGCRAARPGRRPRAASVDSEEEIRHQSESPVKTYILPDSRTVGRIALPRSMRTGEILTSLAGSNSSKHHGSKRLSQGTMRLPAPLRSATNRTTMESRSASGRGCSPEFCSYLECMGRASAPRRSGSSESRLLLRVAWIVIGHTYKFKSTDDNFGFGWEMGRIGASLASGHGFSNPFGRFDRAHRVGASAVPVSNLRVCFGFSEFIPKLRHLYC